MMYVCKLYTHKHVGVCVHAHTDLHASKNKEKLPFQMEKYKKVATKDNI